MTENKKSIVEEALLDLQTIKEALNANTKEILRSVAKEEIDSVVKESLNEDMYDEEEVEDDADDAGLNFDSGEEGGEEEIAPADDSVVPAAPMGDTGASDDSDLGGLDLGAQGGVEDYGAEEGGEDYGLDLTGASDDDVIAVYKKLSGEDEIEILSPNEVIIKDPASGSEYNVKLGGGSAAPEAGLETGLDLGADLGLGGEEEIAPAVELEPEMGAEPAAEVPAAPEAPAADGGEETPAPAAPEAGAEEDDDDDELGESVVFEISLGDEDAEEIAEDIIRGKGHDTHVTNGSMETGDIEGTKAPLDSDSGDNLEGGFDDNAVKHANAEGPMVMGESEELEEGEEPEEIEEHIAKGRGEASRVPAKADIGQPVGAGAKSLEEANAKYNALLKQARKLQAENVEFATILKDFRQKLAETVVFNSNLTYATKLFMEHSTTADEKANIIDRFDNDVKTLKESKMLYKTIVNELGRKTPIVESVEKKLVKDASSSASGQLNESTAYVSSETKRIINLINRVENRLQ